MVNRFNIKILKTKRLERVKETSTEKSSLYRIDLRALKNAIFVENINYGCSRYVI